MVSILLIIDNYYLNRYTIETLLRYCAETQVELLVVNNTGDESIVKFLTDIIQNEKYQHVIKVGEINEITFNKAQAYNKLIKESKGDYICIFEANSIVGKNWLYDMIYYHSILPKVGGCAIPEFNTKKTYTGILDKNDEIINVFKTNDNHIDGIALFKKDLLNEGNCFDESQEKDFLKEFSLRISKELWENFYCPMQISINSLKI